MPRHTFPLNHSADLKPHCSLSLSDATKLHPLLRNLVTFSERTNSHTITDDIGLGFFFPPPTLLVIRAIGNHITHPLETHCPRSHFPPERCLVGKAAESRRCSLRYFRSPPGRCWKTSTCRSLARSSGKTSKLSVSVRAPGSARNAPRPSETATSPRLFSPRYQAESPGCESCRIRREQKAIRRTEPPRPAGLADMSHCSPVYSRVAWLGAAVRAPPW